SPPFQSDRRREPSRNPSIIDVSRRAEPCADRPRARRGGPSTSQEGLMMNRRVLVFGPAYLDRVLRVDRELIDPALGPPLDQSVEGVWKFGTADTLDVIDPAGYTIAIEPP